MERYWCEPCQHSHEGVQRPRGASFPLGSRVGPPDGWEGQDSAREVGEDASSEPFDPEVPGFGFTGRS